MSATLTVTVRGTLPSDVFVQVTVYDSAGTKHYSLDRTNVNRVSLTQVYWKIGAIATSPTWRAVVYVQVNACVLAFTESGGITPYQPGKCDRPTRYCGTVLSDTCGVTATLSGC